MRNKFFFLAFSLTTLIACKPKSEFIFHEDMLDDIPDTIIQVNDMINILTDVHLAESAAPVLKNDSINADVLIQSYYPMIFEHYEISQQKFKSSFQYYTEHPLILNYVYQKVIEQLNLMDSGNKTVNDSIKKQTPFTPGK